MEWLIGSLIVGVFLYVVARIGQAIAFAKYVEFMREKR